MPVLALILSEKHIKASIMTNTVCSVSHEGSRLRLMLWSRLPRLLPAGRAKSKHRLLREGGYESSHLWLEVNIRMWTGTEDGDQSVQSSVMIMSIIRRSSPRRRNKSHGVILNDYALWDWIKDFYCRRLFLASPLMSALHWSYNQKCADKIPDESEALGQEDDR